MDRYTAVQAGRFTAVSGKIIVKLGDVEYTATDNEYIPQGASIVASADSQFQIQFADGEIRSNATQLNENSSLIKLDASTDSTTTSSYNRRRW